MKIKSTCLLVMLSSLMLFGTASAQYDIIPEPAQIQSGQEMVKTLNVLSAKQDERLGPEGYALNLTPDGVEVIYGGESGKSFAKVTLTQLKDQLERSPDGIPAGKIIDKPAYPWRGMMCDVSRQFMPAKDLMKFIDVMHFYKFNKLHLHLTDDQGWRLPVPGYDKLASISSTRGDGPNPGSPGFMPASSGMYTKNELKQVVKYCAERGIEVIPEIDVPGHVQALIAAYPEFACPQPKDGFPDNFNAKARTDPKDIKVRTEGGICPNLLCPQSQEMWKFYDAVVRELADIFPSKIVHLGGDEAPTDRWQVCDACKAARAEKGQKDTHAQMHDFFADMTRLLHKHGKTPQFWFELGGDYYQKGQTVYSWRMGKTPATIDKTREAGMKLILSPGEHCYLDYPQMQGHSNRGWMPRTTLEQSYKLDPSYNRPPDQVKHIIGVHCTLWSEQLPTIEHVLYRAYPRAIAIAEKGWTPREKWSWENFSRKMETHKQPFEKRFGYTLERKADNEPAVVPTGKK